MGILQIFDPFLVRRPKNTAPEIGHLYWAPTPTVDEWPRVLEVVRAAPDEHEVTEFRITQIGRGHFTPRNRLPVKQLNLGESEELLIAKAKRRPVVVLATIGAVDTNDLPGEQKRIAKHLNKPRYLVAPTFSVSTGREPGTFGPELVARIRRLQYLHLFCLPDPDRPEQPRSIVRLDQMFATFLGHGCEPCDWMLDSEPMEVLHSQLAILCRSPAAADMECYQTTRALVSGA